MSAGEVDLTEGVTVVESSTRNVASLTPSITETPTFTRHSDSPTSGISIVSTFTQRIVRPRITITEKLAEAEGPGNIEFAYEGQLISDDGRVGYWHWPPKVTKTIVGEDIKINYDYSAGAASPIVDEQYADTNDVTTVEGGETTGLTWVASESKKNEIPS